jgi:chemotaxis protein MotB
MAKKKKQEESKGSNWLATYADMMSLLMCFFVLLFAFSNIDAAKFMEFAASMSPRDTISVFESGSSDGVTMMLGNGIVEMPMIRRVDTENTYDGRGEESDFQRMASDFQTYFADSSMAEQIDLVINDDHINITFRDNILFDSGSATIRTEAVPALDFIGNELRKFPGMLVEIEGHTDNVPMRNSLVFPDNWHLSAGRAISVGRFFVDEKGLSPVSISAVGRGEYLPIATNETAVGRSRNRRVEIRLRPDESAGPILFHDEL